MRVKPQLIKFVVCVSILLFALSDFTGNAQDQPIDPTTLMFSLKWSPDGQRIATVNPYSKVRIFDSTGKLIREMSTKNPDIPLLAVAWSSDGAQIAAGSSDGRIYLWNVNTGKLIEDIVTNHEVIGDLEWKPNSDILISTGPNYLYAYDTISWAYNQVGTGGFRDISWNSDGTLLMVVAPYGLIKIFDGNTFAEVQRLAMLESSRSSIDWNFDESSIIVGTRDDPIIMYDANDLSMAKIVNLDMESNPTRIEIHPVKNLVAIGTFEEVLIVNLDTGEVLGRLPAAGPVVAFGWSPDGTQIAYDNGNSQVIVQDVSITSTDDE